MKTKTQKNQIIKQDFCHCSLLACLLSIIMVFWVAQAQAHGFRYRYVSLAHVHAPQNIISTDFHWLSETGDVYGNAYECGDIDCNFLLPHVAIYRDGVLTISQSYFNGQAANNKGILVGEVFTDPQNYIYQAALYRDDSLTLMPPIQSNEFVSSAVALNDKDIALITSYDDQSTQVLALYRNGKTIPLTIDPAISGLDRLRINNRNIIAGRGVVGENQRGFRHNPRTSETTLLNPLPSESHSWALDINNRGYILGYSFIFGGLERIGIWDKNAHFTTYFVEGTPEFPTISNNLVFNDNNLIVITSVSNPEAERGFSYVVTKPGKRINLANLIANLPNNHSRKFVISDMNNHGDLLGIDPDGYVLLQRIDDSSH